MSAPYTRSADFVEAFSSRRSAKMNAELELIEAGMATLLVDPAFTGAARAITRAITDDSTLLATTEYVNNFWAGVVGGLPVQTGHADEWLTTDGTSAAWSAFPISTQAIFSAASASLQPISSMEVMENGVHATGLGTSCSRVAYGSGDALFVASSDTAQSNVASSPDGQTWTLRAMPSSAAWGVANDGSQWTACALNSTDIANSADGVTWAADTALPAVAHASLGVPPAFVGSRVLVLGDTAATAFYSTDYGHIWSAAQTLPAAAGSTLYVVAGLFVYWASGTTYYTSTTGATGSWTSRTMPVTPSGSTMWQDFDGALIVIAAAGATAYYRSTDGINWVVWGIGQPNATINTNIVTINGVNALITTTFGSAATRHNGAWIRRVSNGAVATGTRGRGAKNAAGTVFVMPTGNSVVRIAPAEGGAATGVFMTP